MVVVDGMVVVVVDGMVVITAKFFWSMVIQPLFLHSFLKVGREAKRLAGGKVGLPHSIMAVRQILVLFVEVRILVGQQVTRNESCGFCFCGGVKEHSELYEQGEARDDAIECPSSRRATF
jgi:hypothetical protein